MAKKGDFFDKVNFIIRAFFDPCDAPLTLWIETAGPAALKAFMTYYALDLINAFSSWARPGKAMRTARGMRKGKWGWKAGRIKKRGFLSSLASFDPGDALGKKMPGFEEMQGRKVTGGVIHLWLLYGIIERIFWWWMVLSIIFDFLFEWMSLFEKSAFCDQQRATVLVATNDGFGGLPVGGWAACMLPNVEKQRGGVQWFAWNGSISGPGGTATFVATCSNNSGITRKMGIKLSVLGGATSGATYEKSALVPPQGSITFEVTADLGRNAIFNTQSWEESTATRYNDLSLVVFRAADPS